MKLLFPITFIRRSLSIVGLTITLAFTQSYAQNGLVVYYDFSGSATDQSGNGNHGTLYGGASASDTLSLGDNTQDYLQMPSSTLNGLQEFAITFKIKFNSFHVIGSWPTNHILSGDKTSLTEAFGFSYDKEFLQWWLAFNGNLYTFYDPDLEPGTWYCFLLERDSTGLISLYRDGIQTGSTYNYTSAINIQSLLIGQEDDCFASCFAQDQCTNAKIDEFKIYNRSLTATEIANGCNPQTPLTQFSSGDKDICEKFCTDFIDSSSNNPTAWHWIFSGGSPSSSTDQNPTGICYTVPGTFDVTLITTNANGNDTLTLYDYITVYPTPPFPTITPLGNTLISSPASFYQWQFNSLDIPGATNQVYTMLQSGFYTVIVGDSNGCQNSSSIKVFLIGIEDVTDDANISIYPNPSSGSFVVELVNGQLMGDVTIDIVNTLGQKVFSSAEKISSADWKKDFELRDLTHGVYFIEIKMQNEVANPNFIGVRKKLVIGD